MSFKTKDIFWSLCRRYSTSSIVGINATIHAVTYCVIGIAYTYIVRVTIPLCLNSKHLIFNNAIDENSSDSLLYSYPASYSALSEILAPHITCEKLASALQVHHFASSAA